MYMCIVLSEVAILAVRSAPTIADTCCRSYLEYRTVTVMLNSLPPYLFWLDSCGIVFTLFTFAINVQCFWFLIDRRSSKLVCVLRCVHSASPIMVHSKAEYVYLLPATMAVTTPMSRLQATVTTNSLFASIELYRAALHRPTEPVLIKVWSERRF